MSIYIFSRPVRTGKTTELLRWCSNKKNIAGIAMPDIDGLRKIMDLRTHELIDAEVNEQAKSHEPIAMSSQPAAHGSELISIGKFKFYRSSFEKANELLLQAWNSKPGWLIIDELGKLELKGEGFSPAAQKIFAEAGGQPEINILIVVREGLVNEITSLFEIKANRTVSKLDEIF